MANPPVKVIVEQCVPFLEPLEEVCDVVRLPYPEITPNAVKDANALIVRTRNKCDAALLEGSKVEFIATATIGCDHIDLSWCAANGIEVANAPGSNAPAVAQYVFSSLMRVINRPLKSYRLGIVGVGHVGGIVQKWARSLDMATMLCDPPRQAAEGGIEWHSLKEIAEKCDIITFHTPLTSSGDYPTYHLAEKEFFESLRRAPIIINSARGAVIDNAAWVEALNAGICGPAIVDCWEGEPNINLELLKLASVATPHIAGYSAEGKWRASKMALDALCRHFNLPLIMPSGKAAPDYPDRIKPAMAYNSYNPLIETELLKDNPSDFETLRNEYILRHEIGA